MGGALEDGPHHAPGLGAGGRRTTSSAGSSRPLTYTAEDAEGLTLLEDAPRTVRGARDLLSVGLQYGNAFGRGFQAAALKPADFFGDDDVLYLMEDAATGEIRLSVLWEWLHKSGRFTDDDEETGVRAGEPLTEELFLRLLDEEYAKLLAAADQDVHEDSKSTTLPIARAIVKAYVLEPVKAPWYIDLLNLNLDNDGPRHRRGADPRVPRRVRPGRHAHHPKPRLRHHQHKRDRPLTHELPLTTPSTDVQEFIDSDRFCRHSPGCTRPARSPSSAARSQPITASPVRTPRPFTRVCVSCSPRRSRSRPSARTRPARP